MSDELPEGWARAALSEIAERITKGATPTSYGHKFQAEGIAFVKVENIVDGRIDHSTIRDRISKAAHESQQRSILEAGDILFSIAGTIGRTCVVTPDDLPANTNQALAIIRGTSRILDSRYLQLVLSESVARRANNEVARGGGMNNISLGDVGEFVVPIAPLLEQRRIVAKVEALLARVNAARERLEKVPRLLKRFRQAVLAKAFRGELVPTEAELAARENRSFQSAAELLGLPPDAMSDELPEGWVFSRLDRLVENLDGKRRPVKSADRALRRGAYPYYGASGQIDTIDDFLFEGTYLLVAEDGANLLSRNTPIAFRASGRFWVNNHAHVLGPKPEADLTFLELFLNSLDLQFVVTGTAQPKLTQAALNALRVPVAPLAEQCRIIVKVEALLAAAAKVEAEAERLARQLERAPQAILQKAFSGELVPTEAELARIEDRSFESAAELLARINQTSVRAGQATPQRGRRSRVDEGQATPVRRVSRAARAR